MTTCTFCGGATTHDGTAHWACGGVLPDDPRHAAVSVADHLVRVLTPKRVSRPDGRAGVVRKPAEVMSPAQLRACLRPELYEHFDAGLALALAAGAVRQESGGSYRLTPARRRSAKPKDDGSAPGLFGLGTT